jgi:signal transduction histidine kinase
MKNSSIFLTPIINAGLTALLVITFSIIYYYTDQNHVRAENQLIVRAVAQNIEASLEARVRALRILGGAELSTKSFDHPEYEKTAQSLLDLYPDVQAINWVNRDGIIEKVFPPSANQAALKKDLLHHEEVMEYLKKSKQTRQAHVSHRLMTYQGVSAFTVYVPIYFEDQFKGWLNGVFRTDDWIKQYLDEQDWNQVRIKIEWDSEFSEPLSLGPTNVDFILAEKVQIQNQNLKFHLGFHQESDQHHIIRKKMIIFVFGFFVIGVVFYLSFHNSVQKHKLLMLNSHLELGHVLISSLTHDIANPLFSLTLIFKKSLSSGTPIADIDKERISTSLKAIQDMLDMGRRIQGVRLGSNELKASRVDLKAALSTALELTTELVNSKGIKINFPESKDQIFVHAELKSLSHNVIPNILTNAVKFSQTNGEIFIFVEQDAERVHVHFEDEGLGLSSAELHNTAWKVQNSKLGTNGEKGSGLGLLQVSYFMQFYGGTFSIANKEPQGVRVRLSFLKA